MRLLPAALVAAGMLLAACGGSSPEDRVEDGLVTLLVSDQSFPAGAITEEEATCAAAATVDAFGAERLAQLGVHSGGGRLDLSRVDANELETLGAAWDGCITELRDLIRDQVFAQLGASVGEDFPLDDGQLNCIATGMTEGFSLGRILEIGLDGTGTLAELPRGEADLVARTVTACADVPAIILGGVADAGLHADVVACIEDRLDPDEVTDLFVRGLLGEPTDEIAVSLRETISACS